MRLQPVDPDTFAFVFNLASAAMDMKLPAGALPTIVGKTIDIEMEPGKPTRITFQNKAVVRMMDAVASQVQEPNARIAAAGRIFHLYGLLETPEAKPFMRSNGEDRMIHPALLSVAAAYPIDADAGFDQGFFTEVAQVADGMTVPEPS
jgi:hypothetical protein